jgi:cell division protease FtsH
MGSLGMMAFESDEEQPFLGYELSQGRDYSEETATRIDEEVERLLNERHEVAHQSLSGQREALDALVQHLLSEETVEQEELERILGPRPAGAQPGDVAPATSEVPPQADKNPEADRNPEADKNPKADENPKGNKKPEADRNPNADGTKRVSTEPRPYG